MEPKAVPYSQLEEGALYEVYVQLPGFTTVAALPYRGRDARGRLNFADGPNAVFVDPAMQPRIYRYEDTF